MSRSESRRHLGYVAQTFFILLCFSLTAFPALGQERGYLTVGAGAFDYLDRDHLAGAFSAQYRFGARVLEGQGPAWFNGLGPEIGLLANTQGGIFGFADVFLDLRPTERLVIWPGGGIGGYRQGDSRDLGGIRQFHSEITFGYHLGPNHLLGLSVQHISNAGTQDWNPGTNLIFLTYSAGWP